MRETEMNVQRWKRCYRRETDGGNSEKTRARQGSRSRKWYVQAVRAESTQETDVKKRGYI